MVEFICMHIWPITTHKTTAMYNNDSQLALLRTVFSTRSLTTLHSGSSMEVLYVFPFATPAVNVGISLLTEQNVVTRCQLMEYST